MNETQVKKYIRDNLEKIMNTHTPFSSGPFKLTSEYKLSNGLLADFAVMDPEWNILALIEAKGGNVNINELVRGIGQIMQYQFNVQNQICGQYHENCISFLVSSDEWAKKFDWTKMAFPKNTRVLLIDEDNDTELSYDLNSKTDINRISTRYDSRDFICICPYYFRDNRLGELYLGLKTIELQSTRQPMGKLTRPTGPAPGKGMGKIILDAGPPNPHNTVNIFITLQKLNFINHENRLTPLGYKFYQMNFKEFCKKIIYEFFFPYTQAVISALLKIAAENGENLDNITASREQIKKTIENMYGEKTILYLTESGKRYLNHWLIVLKEDLGAISFKRNSDTFKINYFPFQGLPFEMPLIKESLDSIKVGYVYKWLKKNKYIE